jgi:hypothetical protein
MTNTILNVGTIKKGQSREANNIGKQDEEK